MTQRSQRFADALRADPGRLDDIRRARMERDLVAVWKHRATARFEVAKTRRSDRRLAWVASAALSGLLGGAVVLYGMRHTQTETTPVAELPAAYFDVRIDDAATQSGAVVEGQTLASGDHGQVQVHIGATRIDMARESRVRFERISGKELRVALASGEISVAYHPERPSQQRLSIETESARVLVVGTEFVVSVDPVGGTFVRVTEGVVRVMSRHGFEDRVLTVGEHVRVEPVDAPEIASPPGVPAPAFAADLDFGESPEAIDIERLVRPVSEPVAVRGAGGGARPVAASNPATSEVNAAPMTPYGLLELARALLRQGRHDQARALLRGLTLGEHAGAPQVEAWTLTAESYTAQGYVPRAADSYRKAADIGRGTQAGHNAVFAWARLLERHTRDQQAAILIYERYLREAPSGALALQAADALCRLGVLSHCE